jgi:hypothetical protein
MQVDKDLKCGFGESLGNFPFMNKCSFCVRNYVDNRFKIALYGSVYACDHKLQSVKYAVSHELRWHYRVSGKT